MGPRSNVASHIKKEILKSFVKYKKKIVKSKLYSEPIKEN